MAHDYRNHVQRSFLSTVFPYCNILVSNSYRNSMTFHNLEKCNCRSNTLFSYCSFSISFYTWLLYIKLFSNFYVAFHCSNNQCLWRLIRWSRFIVLFLFSLPFLFNTFCLSWQIIYVPYFFRINTSLLLVNNRKQCNIFSSNFNKIMIWQNTSAIYIELMHLNTLHLK